MSEIHELKSTDRGTVDPVDPARRAMTAGLAGTALAALLGAPWWVDLAGGVVVLYALLALYLSLVSDMASVSGAMARMASAASRVFPVPRGPIIATMPPARQRAIIF